MISVGIVGGTGYTAGELIRILLSHPKAQISWVYSSSESGNPVFKIHGDLEGDTELIFTDELSWDIDLIFMCLPHGAAKKFFSEHEIPGNIRIIDLSNDYRLGNEAGFVYGLPELNRHEIIQADKIANPGCFATAIQLALLPLADIKALHGDIHITAITGSTGAGKSLSQTSHFTWRTGNISVYKAFRHQHLDEIRQSLVQLQVDYNSNIYFVPMRGNFTRGILASIYTPVNFKTEEAKSIFKKYYKNHPFVVISEHEVDVKRAVNTNKCLLSVHVTDGMIHMVSAIDNLLKGASGQAVQNMNLIFGYEETLGLDLKPLAY